MQKTILLLSLLFATAAAAPNFVVFVADDQGYGDLSVMGHPTLETPNLDRLAREGTRFTQWISANAVCTPSRTGLLTGRLPVRSGMTSTTLQVFFAPDQPGGIQKGETTVAEHLKRAGYITAAVGKWHLGINQNFGDWGSGENDGAHLPTEHGFDSYYGMPLTNNPKCKFNATLESDPERCFVMRDKAVVEQPVILTTLPDRLNREAISFIQREAAAQRPFFLYYGFVQPHTPLFARPQFLGKSARGDYGDAMLDVDASVGEVWDALFSSGVAENTAIFYTSDNGAWLEERLEGGSNGPLHGGKSQNWEGGIRVPGIVWGPGLGVQPRVSRALASSLDLLPTLLEFAGAPPASNASLDGRSIVSVLTGAEPDSETAQARVLFHYCGFNLHAMRLGPWKAHFATPRTTDRDTCRYFPSWDVNGCMCAATANDAHDPPLLFNVDRDIGERYPILPSDPDYATVLQMIQEEKEKHLAGVVPARSQIFTRPLQQLQPCCGTPPNCRCREE